MEKFIIYSEGLRANTISEEKESRVTRSRSHFRCSYQFNMFEFEIRAFLISVSNSAQITVFLAATFVCIDVSYFPTCWIKQHTCQVFRSLGEKRLKY